MKRLKSSMARGRRGSRAAAAMASLALVAALAGCSGDGGGSGEARGLVVAKALDLASLDPARSYCDSCQIYMSNVYDTVISVDVDDPTKLVPRLAKEWSASADNQTFTFTLDPEATFSDGSPVEAKDVKWTWERLSGLKDSPSFFVDGFSSIETPDEGTVVVTFPSPRSNFFLSVTASPTAIINSDVAAQEGKATSGEGADKTDEAEQWFLQNSAGSGPYVLESFEPGSNVKLVRNEKYWGEAPTFPSVEFKNVPDSVSQVQQLEQGSVDIAMEVNFDSLPQLEGKNDITAEVLKGYSQVYLSLGPGSPRPGANHLKDARVREAIRSAINYEQVIENTLDGNGDLQASPLPNGFLGTADLPLPKYDPAKAKSLLAEAGKGDGFTIEANYQKITLYGVDFDVMMQTIKQNLAEVGITVDLNPTDPAKYPSLSKATGTPIGASYFSPDNTDPSAYVSFFGLVENSITGSRAGGGAAGTPITSPAQDALLAQALAASEEEQEPIYAELGQAMINDALILPVVNPNEVRAYASDITGMHRSVVANLDVSELGLK